MRIHIHKIFLDLQKFNFTLQTFSVKRPSSGKLHTKLPEDGCMTENARNCKIENQYQSFLT
jgi:hypothetical protein